MSRWFRMYDDLLDDPKVQRLPPDLFKAWVNMLCITNKHDGVLPDVDLIAYRLRLDVTETERCLEELRLAGLIDGGDTLKPRNWDVWQSGRPGTSEWIKIRETVFRRDDYTCRYCGERGKKLECDHVVPVAKGGSSGESNFVTACRPCNRTKRDKSLEQLGWSL